MRVLLVNDDGIHAPGIHALAVAFRDAGYEVTVSAPDRERSAASHALTMQEPLYIKACHDWEEGITAYQVSGTPADCCQLALECLVKEPVDLVISGVNQGANLGSDTLYSGTVAAAMEGAFHRKKALAVSLASDTSLDFTGACRFALRVADDIASEALPPCAVYNLNVPALPYDQIKGLRAARLAMMHYAGGYDRRISPFGREYYWLRSTLDRDCAMPDTDYTLTYQGWATITPLSWALTDRNVLQCLSSRGGIDDGTV